MTPNYNEEYIPVGYKRRKKEKCPDENIWARGMAPKSRALTKTCSV